MAKKLSIRTFVEELTAACERGDGYIMSSRGQNPRTGALDLSVTKVSSSWKPDGYYFTQYTGSQRQQALKWRQKCVRVWDCNGLAEGIYEIHTGVNINSKARFNYSEWCDPKGTGRIPAAYRVPGAAVFIHSADKGYITHVGYLERPVKAGVTDGDWYVIEARGVMYGVVRTRLYERAWNRWGWMTKYFEYDSDEKALRRGCKGGDVEALQAQLLKLGYELPLYGADGDFGGETERAVKRFQGDHGIVADGIAGELTMGMIDAEIAALEKPAEKPKAQYVRAKEGYKVYVYPAPKVNAKTAFGVLHDDDDPLPYQGIEQDGFLLVVWKGENAWVTNNSKHIEVIEQ